VVDWEFQVTLNSENIQPTRSTTTRRWFPRGGDPSGRFRVIPVEQEVRDDSRVETYEKFSEIIESSARFAVAECICRKEAAMLGRGCDKLLEACMMFDMAADYYIENGFGREISKEEAMQILAKAEEDGLVHHSSNHLGKKIFICNCCGCCCKALSHVNRHGNPDAIARSNYRAVVDPDQCNACEICVDRCQVDAIGMVDDVAAVDEGKCIGCGLCVSICPTEGISLARRTAEEASRIFTDDAELLQTLARTRTSNIFPVAPGSPLVEARNRGARQWSACPRARSVAAPEHDVAAPGDLGSELLRGLDEEDVVLAQQDQAVAGDPAQLADARIGVVVEDRHEVREQLGVAAALDRLQHREGGLRALRRVHPVQEHVLPCQLPAPRDDLVPALPAEGGRHQTAQPEARSAASGR
jgi:Fe-S-cluster-containing hydrogenase component 2